MPVAILAGQPDEILADLLAEVPFDIPVLINADPAPDAAAIIARSTQFAAAKQDALIVTLIPAALPGLKNFPLHQAAATLWAFTRQAALEWAPQKIRVNAVGLGAAPFGPFEADDQAGRAAADSPATIPADAADIARTIRAIADFPSMTGQIIRLGSVGK
jgi:NAD(P)-dependent dehydrogenase (short-subunit alcohol dehydrogenase family)